MSSEENPGIWHTLSHQPRGSFDGESAPTGACRALHVLLRVIPPILLILWMIGINTKETSRVALVVALVLFLVARGCPCPAHLSARVSTLFKFFPLAFVPLIGSYQLMRVYTGEHGIDFAIFTQVIRSIRDSGVPMTSLVAPNPVNFFSHHFSPFLYLLGWCSRLSFEPHVIGIVVQSLSVGFGVFFFYKFCRVLGFNSTTSGIGAALLCLNPCFRSGVSWGIHDEVFSLGLIGAAFYLWLTRRVLACALCLVLLGAFKETFFIATAFAAGLACVAEWRGEKAMNRTAWVYGVTAVVMTLASLFYFVIIPLYPDLFPMSFQPASRVAPLSNLLSPTFVGTKITLLLYLLVPLFGLPLLSRSGLALWLCAAPFWGASLVSNFAEMHKAFNYYAVVPTYVAFFAAAMTVRSFWGGRFMFTPGSLFIVSCVALSSGYAASPFKPMRTLLAKGVIVPDSLAMIPPHLSVVASDFDSVFVLDKRRVVRLWIAERVPTSWDVALVRDKTREAPSDKILRGTTLCYEDPLWRVYCRKGVSLKTEAPPAS